MEDPDCAGYQCKKLIKHDTSLVLCLLDCILTLVWVLQQNCKLCPLASVPFCLCTDPFSLSPSHGSSLWLFLNRVLLQPKFRSFRTACPNTASHAMQRRRWRHTALAASAKGVGRITRLEGWGIGPWGAMQGGTQWRQSEIRFQNTISDCRSTILAVDFYINISNGVYHLCTVGHLYGLCTIAKALFYKHS